MQFKKLNISNKEEKTKEDEILVKGIIEIYKEILRGDRKQFPKGTWQRPDSLINSKKCMKYLIEEKLKLSDDEIKENISTAFFKDNKLSTMLCSCFESSATKAIDFVYPKRFKEWEFKNTPMSYWNKEKAIEATRWLIEEKLKLTEEELKEQLSVKLFKDNKLLSILTLFFNGSPYNAISSVYPRKYKPWEFNNCPKSYWTTEHGIESIKWLLEDKLKFNDEQIKNQFNVDLLKKYNLLGMLDSCFNNSPWKAINSTYPGRFKPWELNQVPRSYWNKENSINAVKWLVEEKLKLTDDELKEKLSAKMFNDNGLSRMLAVCFSSSPYDAINCTYPSKFKKEDFKNYNRKSFK